MTNPLSNIRPPNLALIEGKKSKNGLGNVSGRVLDKMIELKTAPCKSMTGQVIEPVIYIDREDAARLMEFLKDAVVYMEQNGG